jgi:hypothetical protein
MASLAASRSRPHPDVVLERGRAAVSVPGPRSYHRDRHLKSTALIASSSTPNLKETRALKPASNAREHPRNA